MSELFDRRVAVTIGPAGGEGVRVDERFNIEFLVRKSVGSELNRIDCSIFGLSEQTRNQIVRPGNVIQIEAGYVAGPELIVIGDVTRTVVENRFPEIITIIEAGDGAHELRDRKINISFAEGVTVERILEQVAGNLALGRRVTGSRRGLNQRYEKGVSFSGPARQVLDKITGRAGLSWSIQDGDLQILDRVDASQGRGVLLTPDTGLIESPRKLDDEESFTERRRGAGYEVVSFLNPKIRPGEVVVIESRDVSGQFRVDTVEHSGSVRGQDWYSTAEVYADA